MVGAPASELEFSGPPEVPENLAQIPSIPSGPGTFEPSTASPYVQRLAANVKGRWSYAAISDLFIARLGPIRLFTTQS